MPIILVEAENFDVVAVGTPTVACGGNVLHKRWPLLASLLDDMKDERPFVTLALTLFVIKK
jgi:hypothetical protein